MSENLKIWFGDLNFDTLGQHQDLEDTFFFKKYYVPIDILTESSDQPSSCRGKI